METIFDHKITENELKELYIYANTKDDYLKKKRDNYSIIADLYFLFDLRNDQKASRLYFNQLPADYMKNYLWDRAI